MDNNNIKKLKDGTIMRFVPGGETTDGKIVKPFWVSESMVTIRQFKMFCQETGYKFEFPEWSNDDDIATVPISAQSEYVKWAMDGDTFDIDMSLEQSQYLLENNMIPYEEHEDRVLSQQECTCQNHSDSDEDENEFESNPDWWKNE